jgi:hypothetical protein
MIRYTCLCILFIFIPLSICYSDFRTAEKIAPGVVYFHEYYSQGPWHIHVLEIDLLHSGITLESALAKNSLFGREKTSKIASQHNQENHYVVGAINADFFEWNGNPVGGQIIKGQLINEPINRSVFGMTTKGKPFITIINWSGKIVFADKVLYQLQGFNQRRNSDGWFLYNSFYTDDTLSLKAGILLEASLDSKIFSVNESMNFKIQHVREANPVIVNSDRINERIVRLIGPKSEINEFKTGDSFQILIKMEPIQDKIDLLVGGLPRLIREGEVSIEWKKENIRESFAIERHPRTAVGFTKDQQKVLFFVVDGRQPGYSVGMTLQELAIYMCKWGVYQGVNLDGGGSSAMVVHSNVVNQPSDPSGERAVANALMVINSLGRTESKRLNINPDEIFLQPGSKIQFQVNAQEMNYIPVQDPSDSTSWYCSQNLGSVDKRGLFQADSMLSSGYLYVKSDTMIDSARIIISNTLIRRSN